MVLTLAFAVFLLVVFVSFVLTCMPAPLNTEGGRADQRGVHLEPFTFVVDDAIAAETINETEALVDEEESNEPAGRTLQISRSASEPLKEAA